MNFFNKRNITIYTLVALIFSMLFFELGYCNTSFIKQVINKQTVIYNFSLCRFVLYILFITLYCILKNKFIDVAIDTIKNKYKKVLLLILLPLLVVNLSIMIVFIIKLDLIYARAAAIEVIASLLISLFIIYISNDFSKNVIVISCTFGVLFTFTTRFNHAIDEKKHFMSALNVSFLNFDYANKPITDNMIEKLPQLSKFTVIEDFLKNNYTPEVTSEINMEDTPSTPATYNILTYIFPAFGIAIARVLNGSIIDMYICGRLMNLILYTVLIFIAMKLFPYKKNIFFIIAFMPYMLLLAASYSIDGICLGTIFIFTAYCFKIHKENDTITLKQFFILFGLFTILLIGKGLGYILIGFLVAILPLYNTIKKHKKYIHIIIICGIIFVIIATMFLIYMKNKNVTSNGDNRGEVGINGVEQLNLLITNPVHDLKLAIYHIKTTLLSFDWYANLYPSVFFTENSSYISFIMMFFILYIAITEDDYNFKLKDKSILILTFSLIYGMTSVILYLAFTPVGALYVAGYQTRYIFPIIPLLLSCISSSKIKSTKSDNKNMNLALVTGLFLTIGIIQLILV